MTSTAPATEWPLYPDLAGKVALVTGGSKALGAAACRALAWSRRSPPRAAGRSRYPPT